jgi:predicted metal-binding protein
MDCECCSRRITNVRDYFEYYVGKIMIVTCGECYEDLHSGPIEEVDEEMSVADLINALPS